MKKEDIPMVAQLLMSINEIIDKLGVAENKKDIEGITKAKREILNFQKQIDGMI